MFILAIGIHDNPILTMGDATASFLEVTDLTTQNMCLSSLKDFRSKHYQPGTKPWTNTKSRWKDVTSPRRRTITITM
jgi:hypothetical protein